MTGGRHGRLRQYRPVVRATVATTAVVVTVAAVGFLGSRGGYPATRPHLLSGAAWLASAKVGAVTLLDGSSVEVAAQVQVADPGHTVDVVQQGSTAYALDRTTGTLRRVDGATFAKTEPVTPIPGATTDLRAFAGPGAVYALDAGRGVLAEADPQTLAPRGGPVSLAAPVAAQVDDQAASIDGQGRLWVLDSDTGTLDWVDNGRRHSHPHVTTPGTGLLALADGRPVVVDQQKGTATVLDPRSGDAVHTSTLDLRASDRIEVSGSPDSARLYVVASRGILAVCELAASTCAEAVALGSPGNDFGAAVESGGRVFVPDYTGGRVWVVDLDGPRVLAHADVLDPHTRFQLLTRDGVVFFNDPNSERAGVIRLDGGFTPAKKYVPNGPKEGQSDRGGNGPTPTPTPTPTPPTDKNRRPPDPTPGTPTKTPTDTPTGTPTTPDPTGTTPPPPPPSLQISVSKNPATVGDTVGLSVSATGNPQPVSAQWDFGDGGTGSGLNPSHTWSAARTYQVSVVATFPDGRTGSRSVSERVDPPAVPKGTLTVSVSGSGQWKGTITSSPSGINCPGRCTAQFDEGTTVHLTAVPGAGSQWEQYGGDCTDFTGDTCDLTITQAGASVTGFFTEMDQSRTLTVTVQGIGAGVVQVSAPSDGGNCEATCMYKIGETETATLTAGSDDPNFITFDHWTGSCRGKNPTCQLPMSANRSTTAIFRQCPATGCAATNGAPAALRGGTGTRVVQGIRRRRYY